MPRLILQHLPTSQEHMIDLPEDRSVQLTVGRDEGNNIVLPETWNSRRHIMLTTHGSGMVVDVLGRNGIRLEDGRTVRPQSSGPTRLRMESGDRFYIGPDYLFEIAPLRAAPEAEAEAEAPASEPRPRSADEVMRESLPMGRHAGPVPPEGGPEPRLLATSALPVSDQFQDGGPGEYDPSQDPYSAPAQPQEEAYPPADQLVPPPADMAATLDDDRPDPEPAEEPEPAPEPAFMPESGPQSDHDRAAEPAPRDGMDPFAPSSSRPPGPEPEAVFESAPEPQPEEAPAAQEPQPRPAPRFLDPETGLTHDHGEGAGSGPLRQRAKSEPEPKADLEALERSGRTNPYAPAQHVFEQLDDVFKDAEAAVAKVQPRQAEVVGRRFLEALHAETIEYLKKQPFASDELVEVDRSGQTARWIAEKRREWMADERWQGAAEGLADLAAQETWREYKSASAPPAPEALKRSPSRLLDAQEKEEALEASAAAAESAEDFRDALPEDMLSYMLDRYLAGTLLGLLCGLGPLEGMLADAAVEEIFVASRARIIAVRGGTPEEASARFPSEQALVDVLRRALLAGDIEWDGSSLLDSPGLAKLPGGLRVAVVSPTHSPEGVSAYLRRAQRVEFDWHGLVEAGEMNGPMAELLAGAMSGGCGAIVAGPPGSGRSTLLELLAARRDPSDRVATLERGAVELRPPTAASTSLALSPAEENNGQGLRRLASEALGLRPECLAADDLRGAEVGELFADCSRHGCQLIAVADEAPEAPPAKADRVFLVELARVRGRRLVKRLAFGENGRWRDLFVHRPGQKGAESIYNQAAARDFRFTGYLPENLVAQLAADGRLDLVSFFADI